MDDKNKKTPDEEKSKPKDRLLGFGFVLFSIASMLMEKYANFVERHWPRKRDKSCKGFVRPIGSLRIDDLLNTVCASQKKAFIAFVDQGEIIDNFDKHLDDCKNCKKAVEAAFERSAEAFEKVSEHLHKKD